jgi:hypothetical protein
VLTAADPHSPDEVRGRADIIWHSEWLPIFTTGSMPTVAIDCRETIDGASALRQVDPTEVGRSDHAEVFAVSLGDFIAAAVRVLESGTYRYDANLRTWAPLTYLDRWVGERFNYEARA